MSVTFGSETLSESQCEDSNSTLVLSAKTDPEEDSKAEDTTTTSSLTLPFGAAQDEAVSSVLFEEKLASSAAIPKQTRARPKPLDIEQVNSLNERHSRAAMKAPIERQGSLSYPLQVANTSRIRATPGRARVPSTTRVTRTRIISSPQRPGSLSAGPVGYVQTPVSARPQAFESLGEYGIHPRKRASVLSILSILSDPSTLCDEETATDTFRNWVFGYPQAHAHEVAAEICEKPSVAKKLKSFFKKK